KEIAWGIRQHWHQMYPACSLTEDDMARVLLFREFARRPRRVNSLETLGLIALTYPLLQDVRSAPSSWCSHGRTPDEFRSLLKLLLDFFVRANNAVFLPERLRRWLGAYTTESRITSQEGDATRSWLYRWPNNRRS